jgi:hypothetical protein
MEEESPDIEDLRPWAMFHGGRWTKKRPTEPGFYPVASREGAPMCPTRWRLLIRGENRRILEAGVGHNEPGWQGWWWTRPLPSLPKAPSTEWDET